MSLVICILLNVEALRGDGARPFTIYAVHTCHMSPLGGLDLGESDNC